MRLTQRQFKEILSNVMTVPNGAGRLMESIIELAMEGERELYKADSGDVSYFSAPLDVDRVSLYRNCSFSV